MAYSPIYNAFSQKPKRNSFSPSTNFLLALLKDNFSISTWLMFGAFIQGILCLLPYRNIALVLPVTLGLAITFTRTMLQTYGILPNPYLAGVIDGRTSTLYPDEQGNYETPGGNQVCVINLGRKFNHPLGMFSPGAKELGDRFMNMVNDLHQNAPGNGYLGGCPDIEGLLYFDSLQSLHAFAHGPLHTSAMEWWNRDGPNLKHIGIMHEVFLAPKNSWEGIYVNYAPTGMGGTAKQVDVNGEKVWLNPLVKAKGKLIYSKGRMGRPYSADEWPEFERAMKESEAY